LSSFTYHTNHTLTLFFCPLNVSFVRLFDKIIVTSITKCTYIQTHKQTNRQTDKQTNRQTDKQSNRQTVKQTNRQADKQTNRQTDKHTNSQTDKQKIKNCRKARKINKAKPFANQCKTKTKQRESKHSKINKTKQKKSQQN
jgi:hypothetical protein